MTRDPLVGSTIAGFTLLDRVGEGGTATVYKAQHDGHGTVAFKVLKEKLRQDRTAVARFTREANFGTRVTHPNVIRTIQTGEDAGLPFLVIEWAAGELMESYAKRNAPFPPDEVASIISQIAGAVYAAHQAGIVHRDLKPDNVMYDHDTRTVKLLDFGIATATDVTPDQRLTRAGFFVGTLMYVAPEALSGEVVSPAADQYSLATMAYQFLTGSLPYTAKSPREMFTQLLSQPPVALNKAKSELQYHPAVEAVVMRGLSKAPKERYATVVEFAEALGAALKDPFPADTPTGGFLSRMRGLFGGNR
ncbi:MAG: serine/threonine protein kinase [Gemmatimonadaceae bacterium]|nr:serine/threonine protein kinase [Gemmatimonadaceae bacterium]